MEGRARSRRSTPCSATRSRRCASSPILAVAGHARARPRDLAAHRPRRDARGDQRLPDAAAWGGYPGGSTVEKGAPLFPRIDRLTVDAMRWTDNHCHLPDDAAEAAEHGRRRPGPPASSG